MFVFRNVNQNEKFHQSPKAELKNAKPLAEIHLSKSKKYYYSSAISKNNSLKVDV